MQELIQIKSEFLFAELLSGKDNLGTLLPNRIKPSKEQSSAALKYIVFFKEQSALLYPLVRLQKPHLSLVHHVVQKIIGKEIVEMKANLIKCSKSLLISFLLVCLTFSGVIYAEEVGEMAVANTAIAVDVIVDINQDTRAITLKSEGDGGEWVFNAGPEVRNFDQLKRGDLVITEYYSAFAIALEPKGTALKKRLDGSELDRAAPGEKPVMEYSNATYVAATITDVDLEKGTVTLEGEYGSLTTTVSSDLDLEAIEVGQEVEALYVESMAISVEPAPKVSGTVRMKFTAVALGIGVEWGEGSLTMYDGSNHDFKISGMTLLDVGITGVEAEGEVYHLVEAKDLEGTYASAEAGAVLVKGGSALALKNGNGVILKLKSTQKGARLTLAVEGLKVKMK